MGFFNDLTGGVSARADAKSMTKLFLPPFLIEIKRAIVSELDRRPWLEYAPAGWKTAMPQRQMSGWDSAQAAETERVKWQAFCANLAGAGPLAFSHESHNLSTMHVAFHNINMTYAYVLSLAAQGKKAVSVLDWGGSLGHYYLLGQALLPDVMIDFHCKEVPRTAEIGRRLNPAVHWYSDESCLTGAYDLVMLNGVLQYMEDWPDMLRRITQVVKGYLFLGMLPLVERGPGFVALQRHYGAEMLHEQFNRQRLLMVIEGTGMHLMREFVTGYRPPIKHAPEQCELRSWLFKGSSND